MNRLYALICILNKRLLLLQVAVGNAIPSVLAASECSVVISLYFISPQPVAVAVWLVSKRQQLPSMQRTPADRRLASELREGAALFISILDLAC